MSDKKTVKREYNGCEVTITFNGGNEKVMEEVKRILLDSYYERVKYTPNITMSSNKSIPDAS